MIELENVAYSYGGGELLSDISVKLAPGSFHFLTGPSGAGKTTLLKLCYGALLPTAGHVRLFERDVRALERDDVAMVRRKVGVVHQDVQFLDHLTVSDNVALPLTVSGRHGHAAVPHLERAVVAFASLGGFELSATSRVDALLRALESRHHERADLPPWYAGSGDAPWDTVPVATPAIGGLHEQVIGVRHRLRVMENRAAPAPEIA